MGHVRFYSCHYIYRRQSVMYLKALLGLYVVCVYVNPYYIQRDRRIINAHPLPTGEV